MLTEPYMLQKIIHMDADCFYAAVEMRDTPSYVGQPLAVGGPADRRGVVATCNYEARAFGVRSAMPTRHALRLCPQLIIVPPDFQRYRAASQAIFAIYRSYTDTIEPLSLDEAYLDVTHCHLHEGIATKIAAEIRQRVKNEVGLTVSAGVAPNKFLAKIASDWDKPDGLFVIRPHQIDAFILDLPIERLHGVGPKTAARMHRLGLKTCADVRLKELPFLIEQFGKMGLHLYQLSRGIDNRRVQSSQIRKSISVETTFLNDVQGYDQCLKELTPLFNQLQQRIEQSKAQNVIQKLYLKIRLSNFAIRSIEQSATRLEMPHVATLLKTICNRHDDPAIRLLGIGVRLGDHTHKAQFELLPT